jgi:hypothetical protein
MMGMKDGKVSLTNFSALSKDGPGIKPTFLL